MAESLQALPDNYGFVMERQILYGVDKERLLWFLSAINGGTSRSAGITPAPSPPFPSGDGLLQESGGTDFIVQESSTGNNDFIVQES